MNTIKFFVTAICIVVACVAFASYSESEKKKNQIDPCGRLDVHELSKLIPEYRSQWHQLEERHHLDLNRLFYHQDLRIGPIEAKLDYLIASGQLDAADNLSNHYLKVAQTDAREILRLIDGQKQGHEELCKKMFPHIYANEKM